MSYWEMFSDPWSTIDESINRAQAAAQRGYDTAYSYSPIGLGQQAYENLPTGETILETIDEYTYTPWEMSNDISEYALEQLEKVNPLNSLPEVNWGRVAIVVGVMALGGTALYMAMKR